MLVVILMVVVSVSVSVSVAVVMVVVVVIVKVVMVAVAMRAGVYPGATIVPIEAIIGVRRPQETTQSITAQRGSVSDWTRDKTPRHQGGRGNLNKADFHNPDRDHMITGSHGQDHKITGSGTQDHRIIGSDHRIVGLRVDTLSASFSAPIPHPDLVHLRDNGGHEDGESRDGAEGQASQEDHKGHAHESA